ncbi:MAG: fumarylacetoacetate hydrolase family protein [SAR324 cluster bacterium]|nr:fumarylacetoacetate hydrolase family protein [SAR324 cluster bacterium]
MVYQHSFDDGTSCELSPGKVVCVGRNYVEHIKELNNPLPTEPVLFIKPATSLQSLSEEIVIPAYAENCHHETELAVLVGEKLGSLDPAGAKQAIAGYGIALDLTLRDLQQKLKDKGLPWEKAKAFDGSCPISPFIKPEQLANPQDTMLKLTVNGTVRQEESTRLMMTGILDLMIYISGFFSLMPGDIVLTGTPAGVSQLKSGDQLELQLDGRFNYAVSVR